jgi:ATP synthase protein I
MVRRKCVAAIFLSKNCEVLSVPRARSIDSLVLLRAGVVTAVAGVVVVIIAAVLSGGSAALGAFLGTALVIVFFSVGQFALGSVLRNNPQMALTMALTIYLVKIGVLLLILVLFADTTAFDTKTFALAILVCTLVWTVMEVWIFGTTKVLYVEPNSMGDSPSEKSDK